MEEIGTYGLVSNSDIGNSRNVGDFRWSLSSSQACWSPSPSRQDPLKRCVLCILDIRLFGAGFKPIVPLRRLPDLREQGWMLLQSLGCLKCCSDRCSHFTASRWVHTSISANCIKRSSLTCCDSSFVSGGLNKTHSFSHANCDLIQMLGVPSVERYPPGIPPVSPGQSAPFGLQSKARLCCLPCAGQAG